MAGPHVSRGTVENRGVAKSPMRGLNTGLAAKLRVFRLTRTQEIFCFEYLANGYNGTAAYKKTYPRCKSDGAARVEAHRLLTKPNVRRFLEVEQESRRERLRMEADEALALISIIARADVRDIFNDQGAVLPVHLWPDCIRLAVKSIRCGRFGPSVVFYDGLRARELMARAAGKLGSPACTVAFDHEGYLADVDREHPPVHRL